MKSRILILLIVKVVFGNLTDSAIPVQSGPEGNGSKYTRHTLVGMTYPSVDMQSKYSTAPDDCGGESIRRKSKLEQTKTHTHTHTHTHIYI